MPSRFLPAWSSRSSTRRHFSLRPWMMTFGRPVSSSSVISIRAATMRSSATPPPARNAPTRSISGFFASASRSTSVGPPDKSSPSSLLPAASSAASHSTSVMSACTKLSMR